MRLCLEVTYQTQGVFHQDFQTPRSGLEKGSTDKEFSAACIMLGYLLKCIIKYLLKCIIKYRNNEGI